MRSDLGSPQPDFAGSHELIPALLGATAFLDELARCIDEPSVGKAESGTDGLLVDSLLGLLALRRALRLWIEGGEAQYVTTAASPPSSSPGEGSYLR